MSESVTWMREAIALGRTHSHAGEGGPFGAVVVRDGEIVGRGWNQVLTSHDPTMHAEISAIRDACQHLQTEHLPDCQLFSSCEPCPMCRAATQWARIPISSVFFAAGAEDAAAVGFDDAAFYEDFGISFKNRKTLWHPENQILQDEAVQMMQDWKATFGDKNLY